MLETLPPLAPNVMGWSGLSAFNDPEDGLLAIADGKVYTNTDPPVGPWDLPPGAYSGIALEYDRCAGVSFCGDANCSGTQDAEDIDPFFLRYRATLTRGLTLPRGVDALFDPVA